MEWKFLPFPGSLLDQPEWLMDDLTTISWRKKIVKELIRAPVVVGGLFRDYR